MSRFDEFWALYPRKVGKLKAEPAYGKALKLASHEKIMDGVRRYLKSKPAYADWAHPTTWLNAGRWMDEPDAKPIVRHEPRTKQQIIDSAVWKIRHGTGDGHKFPVDRHIALACVKAGLVTEEQARPWL